MTISLMLIKWVKPLYHHMMIPSTLALKAVMFQEYKCFIERFIGELPQNCTKEHSGKDVPHHLLTGLYFSEKIELSKLLL